MKANLRRLSVALALAFLFPLLSGHSLQAAVSGFIKIGDIEGESQNAGHVGDIEVQSLSWGVERAASADKGSPASFADLKIVKPVDKATPYLFQACAMGKIFAQCELTLERPYDTGVEQPYLSITLKNVIVTSTSLDVPTPSTGEPLTETLSLNFSEMEMKYFARSASGDLQAVHHIIVNLQTATP